MFYCIVLFLVRYCCVGNCGYIIKCYYFFSYKYIIVGLIILYDWKDKVGYWEGVCYIYVVS